MLKYLIGAQYNLLDRPSPQCIPISPLRHIIIFMENLILGLAADYPILKLFNYHDYLRSPSRDCVVALRL